MIPGIGVIWTSIVLGLLCRRRISGRLDALRPIELYLLGVLVHVAMVLWMLALPRGLDLQTMGDIAGPVLLVLPLATLFLGWVLLEQHVHLHQEQALRANERELHSLLRAAPIGIGMVVDRVFQRVNERFCQMLGYSEGELLGQSARMVYPDQETYDEVGKVKYGQIAQVGVGAIETRMRRKDGQILDVLLSSAPLDPEDWSKGVVFTVLDIAARKRQEAELERYRQELEMRVRQRTAELEEANRELESFVYSISHDLRAPLRAIIGFGEILAERHGDRLDDEGRRYLNYVLEAGNKMRRLIEDLQAYSRLGHSAVTMSNVPLGEVVEAAWTVLETKAQETGGQLCVAHPLPTVWGNADLLERILTNLLDNALTYHRPGVAPQIEITAKEEEDWVTLSVRDNGLGIDPRFHERIFRLFQRLHTDDAYPGTGVGLAIVRRSVELLGGEVGVTSNLGDGSTFWVRLRRGMDEGVGDSAG